MWALVSSAISTALSPPHVPARSFGGLRPVGSHGPRTAAAAANAKAALVSTEPPYQSTLCKPPYVTMTLRSLFFLVCFGLTSATAQQRPLDGFDAYVAKAMT